MKCRNCRKNLPLRSVECDNCGTPTKRKEYLTKRILIIASAVLLLAAIVGLLSRCEWKLPEPSDPADTVASSGNTTQPTGPIGEDKAADLALDYMDHNREDVVNLQCSLDDSDPAKPRYFVTYEKEPYGYELQVHALTGKVLRVYNYLLPVPTDPQPTETEPQPMETEPTETEPPPTGSPVPLADGMSFIYKGKVPFLWAERNPEDVCAAGHLYYMNRDTEDAFLICGEPVELAMDLGNAVCFVKSAELNRVYITYLSDFSSHSLLYETDAKGINQLAEVSHQYTNKVVVLLEDHCRVVWVDMETGASKVLMEQYYIMSAGIWGKEEVVDGQTIFAELEVMFTGKLSTDDQLNGYIYNCTTGEITYQPEL